MLSTDGGGTHWFQAWHRIRQPGVPWPGTETGSGPCGSLWRTSACLSPQSHYLSAAQWTCHLNHREARGRSRRWKKDNKTNNYHINHKHKEYCKKYWWWAWGLLSHILPIVSMVSRSSMRSWALGMSMCILNVCCCLFTVSGVRVFLLKKKKITYFFYWHYLIPLLLTQLDA